jgi:hypothetical protein
MRFADNPIFLEALQDYMEDSERHNLTSGYWAKQFSAIDDELIKLENDRRKQLIAGKTKDYATTLKLAREMMKNNETSS